MNVTKDGMKKIALISCCKVPSWKSCQVISSNLVSCYQRLYSEDDLRVFNIEDSANKYEVYKATKQLAEFAPEKIIFTEHRPHPQIVIDFFYKNFKGQALPELIFHVFGDFTLYSTEWAKLEKTLESFRVKFLCASDAQVELVSSFIVSAEQFVFKCPFPVDTSSFYFDFKRRNDTRKKMNLSDSSVFLYTGRVSLQKQTLELINSFTSFVTSIPNDSILLIAGEFDDLGVPYLLHETCYNSYYMMYRQLISALPQDIADRVIYLGNLDSDQLLDVYCASDCFVSLSVHNDEDYGMSPAEALCTGVPAILTRWGGYSSFQIAGEEKHCALIPVEIGESKLIVNENVFMKHLLRVSFASADSIYRERYSEMYEKKLSIMAIALKIEKILRIDTFYFAGFSEALVKLVKSERYSDPPFANSKYVYNSFYKEIYDVYTK
ncbi:MAG: glycosyltransferase family 4 protein [Bacteriovoracaceae bacterium]|nr:glycosyltransferase family 4 protein [Bacteriovoracaceae bacterium]